MHRLPDCMMMNKICGRMAYVSHCLLIATRSSPMHGVLVGGDFIMVIINAEPSPLL